MANNKIDIYIYGHWQGMKEPMYIGVLSALIAKGKKAFSFEYDPSWIKSKKEILIDPEITWFTGPQYPIGKDIFGAFTDSMPDTWGRTLMKRRNAQIAKETGKPVKSLYEIDYLLGVFDQTRMGALRFKLQKEGPFLDDNQGMPTPPWTSIKELQYGAEILEKDENGLEVKKWLAILMAPGSSLGGARPKANITDNKGNLWIAKFPSKNDTVDKGAWEYLAYKLAVKSGITMAESRIEKITGKYHTFFTKRFDRKLNERIHFASAMTMLGKNEDIIKQTSASYLELAEFIQFNCTNSKIYLKELWRRIVFNICISNTDDHLRNHGFILAEKGWILSPAFDINPSIDKDTLSLNINMENNSLDIDLAKSVGEYFQLSNNEMNAIISEIQLAVKGWKKIANEIEISKVEQEIMSTAFIC